MTNRRLRNVAAATALAAGLMGLAACGSSSSTASNSTDAAASADTTAAAADTTAAAAPDTTAAPADTTAAAAQTTAPAAVDTTVSGSATPAGVDVKLVEWSITAPSTVAAGDVTFNVANGGNFSHELLVIKGDSYKSLPLAGNGSVNVAQLPAGALVGGTDRIDGGGSASLTVDLPAGHYVLLCNIVGGGSSHAARGQVTEIDVA